MTTVTISAKGDKQEMIGMLTERLKDPKDDKLIKDIISALIRHVSQVSDKDVVTFSIRGQITVNLLKRNHQRY
jgi:hypothetical protein